jgi:hypothetical protein
LDNISGRAVRAGTGPLLGNISGSSTGKGQDHSYYGHTAACMGEGRGDRRGTLSVHQLTCNVDTSNTALIIEAMIVSQIMRQCVGSG